ncbi:hypothetical protein SD457_14120 [Coprobacillaceae bacterium CR2/5/TPMF4]|nr:hypothetical protein SD457_14120 [Coprobacillaceae bacterium CR2/5/TPMF4]
MKNVFNGTKTGIFKKEYNCNDENMNISVFRGDEDRMKDVYEDLITPPFLLIIRWLF